MLTANQRVNTIRLNYLNHLWRAQHFSMVFTNHVLSVKREAILLKRISRLCGHFNISSRNSYYGANRTLTKEGIAFAIITAIIFAFV